MSDSHPSNHQSWAYMQIASLPLPASIEDHLLGALRQLTATLDVRGVCEAVLSGVEAAFGATSSWVMLHDRRQNVLRTVLFRGRGADVYGHVSVPASRGIVGDVFTRGEIQFVPDASSEDRWFDPEAVRSSGLQSVFLLPLVEGERRLGVLGVGLDRVDPHHPLRSIDVKRLEIFAAQAAVGLRHARRYQASRRERARLRRLLQERRALQNEVVTLRSDIKAAHAFGAILGRSAAFQRVLDDLEQVASSAVTVLLLGETGSGKELLARVLHERSSRAARPFIPVNCAALPESLVESEMFGHERGAFTGAHARKPGRFELANRGTLLLDEVGDLPLGAQAKLLRVLQDGEVYRVGSTSPVTVDVRVLAATNRDLAACVADGTFRADLFYRLSVFPIRIPPLRERREDIPELAIHLISQCAARLGKHVRGIEQAALDELVAYDWPGNVRELRNVIERACILTKSEVLTADCVRLEAGTLSAAVTATQPSSPASASAPAAGSRESLADAERRAIINALRQSEGRVSGPQGAAARLRLRPTTLHAKMKKLGVRRADMLKGD